MVESKMGGVTFGEKKIQLQPKFTLGGTPLLGLEIEMSDGGSMHGGENQK